MASINKVLYDVDQRADTTAAEKQTARNNIGAVSATDLITEISRAQTAEAAAKTEVVQGTGISVTSTTGASGQTVYTVSNTNDHGTQVTLTTEGPETTVTTNVQNLDIDIDNGVVRADSSSLGFIAPLMTQPNEKRILTLPAGAYQPSWEIGMLYYPIIYQGQNVTYADVVSVILQGYAPVLVDSNGRFIANYKYYSSTMVLFQGFNAQPMHMTEYWLKNDNTWETHQRDIFDTSIIEVYTNDRVGTSFQQATLPNMDFTINSYLNPGSGWKDHTGTAISGTMFDEFRSKKPELVRYDYSSDLAYVLDSAPAGTPTAVLTVRLEMFYRMAQNDPYVTFNQYWAPTVTIPFSTFTEVPTSGGSMFVSEPKPFNYSVTFDRQRFESTFANVNDAGFQLVGTISNITPPGTIHDLRQVAASSKWVFQDHV